MLRLAGQVANIAGLAGISHNRDATEVELTHFDTAGLDNRIAVVREAAGDRFDAIELNALIQFVVPTDDRGPRPPSWPPRSAGPHRSSSGFAVRSARHARADGRELVERQQRFGVSYWTVFDEWVGRESAMPDIAKVIALLR